MIKKDSFLPFVLTASLLASCSGTTEGPASDLLMDMASEYENIQGSQEYLNSPFVTAGDRVYMVGHQDGSFPDLGWHIDGEMGGIWNHPIKLMDGFSMMIVEEERDVWVLDSAVSFHSFPFGNLHRFKNKDFAIERFQFVPEKVEGLVVEVSIRNTSADSKSLDLVFTGHVDLSPPWLAERQEVVDGEDAGDYRKDVNAYVAKDENNPWFVTFGGGDGFSPTEMAVSIDRKGKGRDYSLAKSLTLESGKSATVRFQIAGSYESESNALNTLTQLRENSNQLLSEKIEAYANLQTVNELATGDPAVDEMFRWIKFNSQWLVRDVPEVGRGVSAGIPDYPWWFGTDGAYIIQGLVSAGMHEEAMNTIHLIMDLSRKENGNGKIVHEVSSNGIVFNPGNLNTTPTFIYALWKAYQWTGDDRILNYYEDIKQGIAWIESMDKDGNGYPDGAGMMEIHGLHSEMIDVVAYLAKAYEAASNFAEVKGDSSLAEQYAQKALELTDKINSDWWVEESASYADFRSSKAEALELIEAAIVRADTINKPWSVEELTETRAKTGQMEEKLQGFVVHHNWVVNTPMEVGLASPENARKALETAKKYRNKFGMFVTGIDRDENQEKAEKWKAFSYVGAVMTLPTGVQAISEAKYGNADASLEYLKMLENSFSYALPGSMYEVSPDFGMVAQGWNVYAVAVPIVDHFFGIQPEAFKKEITIEPQMPPAWNEAKLEKVQIGDNEISIVFQREGGQERYEITQKLDWKINFIGEDNQVAIIQ